MGSYCSRTQKKHDLDVEQCQLQEKDNLLQIATQNTDDNVKERSVTSHWQPVEWKSGQVVNGIIPIQMYRLNSQVYWHSTDWEVQIFISNCGNQFEIKSTNTDNNSNDNDDTKIRIRTLLSDCEDWKQGKMYHINFDYTSGSKFFIRVPPTLTKTDIQVKIALQHKPGWIDKTLQSANLVRNSMISAANHETQTVEIQSILFNQPFDIGDSVMVNRPNSMHVHPAMIVQKTVRMPNNEILVLRNGHDRNNNNNGSVVKYTVRSYGDVFDVLPNEVFNPTSKKIAYSRIVDTCNTGNYRLNMECDLILGSKDRNIREFYCNLRQILVNIYQETSFMKNRQHERYCKLKFRYNYQFLSGYFSNIICDYLFDLENDTNKAKYQIRCFQNSSFDSQDGFLCFEQLWKYKIQNRLKEIELRMNSYTNVQDFRNNGYCCDLCNVYIHVNDWVANCHRSVPHDYCLPCVYSMTQQIVTFEKYLQNIINEQYNEYLTMDCMQILVSFVLGYANVRLSNM